MGGLTIKIAMKQFNLEEYLRLKEEGKEPKIVTRDGRDVRIICTDRNNTDGCIVALINNDGIETAMGFYENGNYLSYMEDDRDLFFADPEPTYRPYKDADECFMSLKEHDMIVRHTDGDYHLVVTINDSHIWLGNAQIGFTHEQLLNEFTFIDGSPCGVKEGEA